MSALHSRASLFKGRFELNQTYSEPNLCDMWTEDDGIAFIEKKKKKKKEAFQSRCHSRASKSCFFGSMIDLSGKRSLFVEE